jgi:hypothetical protein
MTMVSRYALLLSLLLPPNASQERPVVTIPRIEAAARLDGVLDEPVWQQAARLTGFHQYEPVDSRPAEEQTEVLVWYAPDAIYFGIRALDSQSGTVRATNADRDNIESDDNVTIYLDTFNDRRRAFFFAVNPLGVQQDGVRTEGASSATHMFGGEIDTSPDFIYESHGRVTPEGYVVEVRIPFKTLRFPGSGPQQWGLQVERVVQRTGYTDTWTDVRRASASYLLQAGTIAGLHDLERGVVIETQPFVTATAAGERASTGAFVREDVARRLHQPGARRDCESRLQPGRKRRRPGHDQRALRAVLPGEATVLPGGHRPVQHPQPAGLHAPDRGPDHGREADRQARPLRPGPPHGRG